MSLSTILCHLEARYPKLREVLAQTRGLHAPSAKLLPFPCLYIAEEPDLIVELCRIRIFYKDDPLYSEMRVHDFGVRRISLHGLERSKSKSDLERVWKGVDLLRRINKQLGRKKGSTLIALGDFLTRAPKTYRELLDQMGEHPLGADVAAALYISKSTFDRNASFNP